MAIFLLSVGIALGISATCSLLEAVLLSLPAGSVATVSARHPAAGRIWHQFKRNIEKPIAVILVVNTAAHTIGATVAGAEFEILFGTRYLIVFSLIFTYLMLQFTEILPKTLGVRYNQPLSVVVARPLSWLVRIMAPVLWLIHFVNRPFQGPVGQKGPTTDEIGALAAAAQQARSIDTGLARMIAATSAFSDILVRQVMTPRMRIAFLEAGQPIEEILKLVRESPYTRLPLCDKGIDHVIGLVHIKDLFRQLDLTPGKIDMSKVMLAEGRARVEKGEAPGGGLHVIGSGNIDLMKIRREVLFFPETITIQKALRSFQSSRTHLGVVVDEYGATLGIVTLEDVVEEIVGEIEDEFDRPAPPQIVAEEGRYRVSGEAPMHEVQRQLHIPDEAVLGADTVGGYVLKVLGRIPEAGEKVRCGRYVIVVAKADARRVREVVFEEESEEG